MSRFRRRRTVACAQLVELVTDYLEGGLRPAQRVAVEEHLAVCSHCAGYVEQVREMLVLTAATHDDRVQIAPDVLDELTARFRSRH